MMLNLKKEDLAESIESDIAESGVILGPKSSIPVEEDPKEE